MTGRILRLSPIALVLVAAACGGGGGSKTTTTSSPTTTPTTTTTATTTPTGTTSFRVYFLLNGKVQPVARTVPSTRAVATTAYTELVKGPTAQETGIGLTTSMPADAGTGWTIAIGSDGLLTLDSEPLAGAALAQAVYTLTQFPGRQTVVVNGTKHTRNDFEDVTPAILVELPLPFERVAGKLRLAGSSNTFEATFQYELKDASGKVLAKHFVTATSGNGVRGTFDVTIPFTVAGVHDGTLGVYENSAATGKRVHEVDIPLTLQP
jgi:hypothetical protein